MAKKATEAFGGARLFGVKFFLTNQGVYFSEISSRKLRYLKGDFCRKLKFNVFELYLLTI